MKFGRTITAALIVTGAIASIIAAGCTPATPVTQVVTVSVGSRPDSMSVHLELAKAGSVQWSNTGGQNLQIVFIHGGPGTIDVPANGRSRIVAVSEFGSRGSYPYHVRGVGAAAGQSPAREDTTGGPGDPDVDVR